MNRFGIYCLAFTFLLVSTPINASARDLQSSTIATAKTVIARTVIDGEIIEIPAELLDCHDNIECHDAIVEHAISPGRVPRPVRPESSSRTQPRRSIPICLGLWVIARDPITGRLGFWCLGDLR
jgi:hypothetical protein